MMDSREEILGDLKQPGMFRVAVLEYIEKERAVVNAGAEQHHVGCRI